MPDYATGPNRHSRRGPVDAAYAETGAIDVPCPNCGAEVESFCTHPDGTFRKIPCPTRLTAATRSHE